MIWNKEIYSKEKERRSKANRELWKVVLAAILLSALLITYLVYFVSIDSEKIIDNVHNVHLPDKKENVMIGSILSFDGSILAETILREDGTQVRNYPFGAIFAHPVGYQNQEGESELEAAYASVLQESSLSLPAQIQKQLNGDKLVGDSIITTLDSQLQSVCYELLGERKGSIVVLEVTSGRVLAMVSTPSYDPNTMEENWELLKQSEGKNLVNRATQMLYPPASTFKVLTLLEFMREHPDYESYSYECTGSEATDGYTLGCFGGAIHGAETLAQALQVSCNTIFAHIAKELNRTSWTEMLQAFGFNERIDFDIPLLTSSFSADASDSEAQIMMRAIGQENVRVTLLMNTMIMAAIANEGVLMSPYLVEQVRTMDGNVVEIFQGTQKKTMSVQESRVLKQYLREVVDNGSGSAAKSDIVTIAGKTGSAQYEDHGQDYHGWFSGFAPVENSEIAVSVLLETGATGGGDAAPIAKQVIEFYFQNR